MAPTLSLNIGEFAPAGTGDWAARSSESPIPLRPGGSQDAVNGYGFAAALFPRNCSKRQVKQQSHLGAASPRTQRPVLRRGDWQ